MSVMGQMMKSKKTEITDKLRQEINKARSRPARRARLGRVARPAPVCFTTICELALL